MGFESIDQPGQSSEIEHNQNMCISFFWQETGGGWGSSPLTSPADHQKLNVMQKWAFHFIGWRGVADEVQVHQSARQIIRSERNPKMSISFYWLERGGGWGLSPLTSPANHQKLNIIKICAFHFFGRRQVVDGIQVHQQARAFHFIGWRGVADGVWVHRTAWLIIRNWT